jgi:hypothetical protein
LPLEEIDLDSENDVTASAASVVMSRNDKKEETTENKMAGGVYE